MPLKTVNSFGSKYLDIWILWASTEKQCYDKQLYKHSYFGFGPNFFLRHHTIRKHHGDKIMLEMNSDIGWHFQLIILFNYFKQTFFGFILC